MKANNLTPSERERITRGLVDLRSISRHLVPFEAHRLRRPRVLWLNDRWFLHRGADIGDDEVRRRVCALVLDDFAFAVRTDDADAQDFTDEVATLFADRYGSNSGLFAHGGSGRAAAIGHFHVKGVGITPLVGAGVDRAHSHGCASLDVALREAIYGEVSDIEFPHGAIPVIALIDTGLAFDSTPSREGESRKLRRALIVRPSIVRPAHLQRAPAFLKSVTGYANRQIDDVQRTKEFMAALFARDGLLQRARPAYDLVGFFRIIAQQVAFGQIHRLYNGGYFSSNLTIDGELVDFGNMHVFANWANAQVLDADGGFGRELDVVHGTIRSLVFYHNKYLPEGCVPASENAILKAMLAAYDEAFDRECLRAWGLEGQHRSGVLAEIPRAVRSVFARQQGTTVNVSHGESSDLPSLHDTIVGARADASTASAIERIDRALRVYFEPMAQAPQRRRSAWATAARILKPRDAIVRDRLREKIAALLAAYPLETTIPATAIANLVTACVDASRRCWDALPPDLSVTAHRYDATSSALRCVDLAGATHVLLQGRRIDDALHYFRQRVPLRDARDAVAWNGEFDWTACVRMDATRGDDIRLGRHVVQVPAMTVEYEPPAAMFTG